MNPSVKSVLRRLEREVTAWREEPMKRVSVRNKLLHPLREHQFSSFGADSIIDRPMWLYGASRIAVGSQVIFLRGAWLAVERVGWDEPGDVLTIGDGSAFRVGATISASKSIVIEDNVGAGAYVSIIDGNHTWKGGNPNPLYNPTDISPIRVGAGTWLGDRVTIAAGTDVGVQCALAANCVVSGTIPDYSIVVGNPGRVVGKTNT